MRAELGGPVDRVKRSLEGDDLSLAQDAVDDFEDALELADGVTRSSRLRREGDDRAP